MALAKTALNDLAHNSLRNSQLKQQTAAKSYSEHSLATQRSLTAVLLNNICKPITIDLKALRHIIFIVVWRSLTFPNSLYQCDEQLLFAKH